MKKNLTLILYRIQARGTSSFNKIHANFPSILSSALLLRCSKIVPKNHHVPKSYPVLEHVLEHLTLYNIRIYSKMFQKFPILEQTQLFL